MEDATKEQPASAKRPRARFGVALVTGGRRGIGRAVCVELAARGFDLAVVDYVNEGAQETIALVESFGRRARFLPLDISRTNDHAAVLDQASRDLGPITCLVNNAGVMVSVRGDLLDVDEAEFDRLIGVNLRGTFFLTKAVAREMLATPDPIAERSIITITSANAHLVSPEKGAYCVSKAGLSMAMQAFALRLAEGGIRVHEIRPGLIATDMTAEVRAHYSAGIESGALCALRQWGEPSDIAQAIGTLATGGMPYSTGDIYNIGGGMQIPHL